MLAAAGYCIAPLQDWDAENLTFNEDNELDEVTQMAQMEHEHWCQEKKEDGWRFGPEKNSLKKTNTDREKNKEYIRGLPRLLVQAGFQIENHKNTP